MTTDELKARCETLDAEWPNRDGIAAAILAVIAERDALLAALSEVMTWIGNWSPNFTEDDEWPATARQVREALAPRS